MPNLDAYVDKVLESIEENNKKPEFVIKYDLKDILKDVYNAGYDQGYENGLEEGSYND